MKKCNWCRMVCAGGILMVVAMGANAARPITHAADVKAYALKLCLDGNYAKLGVQGTAETKDMSFLLLGYQLDESRPKVLDRLKSFVNTATENYALAQVSMKDEAKRGPFNKVFIQCMKFYHSRALDGFVQKQLGP